MLCFLGMKYVALVTCKVLNFFLFLQAKFVFCVCVSIVFLVLANLYILRILFEQGLVELVEQQNLRTLRQRQKKNGKSCIYVGAAGKKIFAGANMNRANYKY